MLMLKHVNVANQPLERLRQLHLARRTQGEQSFDDAARQLEAAYTTDGHDDSVFRSNASLHRLGRQRPLLVALNHFDVDHCRGDCRLHHRRIAHPRVAELIDPLVFASSMNTSSAWRAIPSSSTQFVATEASERITPRRSLGTHATRRVALGPRQCRLQSEMLYERIEVLVAVK